MRSNKMPKPNASFTLIELKEYVRNHNLNKPEIKLSMKKPDLIAGLKKHGHWEGSTESEATKKSTRPAGKGGMAKRTGGAPGDGKTETKVAKKRGRPKGSKNKKGTKPKKLSKGQQDFLSGILE